MEKWCEGCGRHQQEPGWLKRRRGPGAAAEKHGARRVRACTQRPRTLPLTRWPVLPARLLQKRLAREAKELEKLEKAAAKVGAGRLLGRIGRLLLEMETEGMMSQVLLMWAQGRASRRCTA